MQNFALTNYSLTKNYKRAISWLYLYCWVFMTNDHPFTSNVCQIDVCTVYIHMLSCLISHLTFKPNPSTWPLMSYWFPYFWICILWCMHSVFDFPINILFHFIYPLFFKICQIDICIVCIPICCFNLGQINLDWIDRQQIDTKQQIMEGKRSQTVKGITNANTIWWWLYTTKGDILV